MFGKRCAACSPWMLVFASIDLRYSAFQFEAAPCSAAQVVRSGLVVL